MNRQQSKGSSTFRYKNITVRHSRFDIRKLDVTVSLTAALELLLTGQFEHLLKLVLDQRIQVRHAFLIAGQGIEINRAFCDCS